MQPSEEIKSRLNVVDVIREYIPVKPAGSAFRALCPFHHEKTPSFHISPEKQIWHCFGCAKGGDMFSFVMEIEGVGFPEALRILGKKAGVEIKNHDPKTTSRNNRILDILELAAKYYYKSLVHSKEGEAARKYLKERGLDEDAIDEWLIGYAPESWDHLLNLLKEKGYKDEEIFLAGMSVKREKMSGYYNRFRARITFPIRDVSGSVVGFSARVLPHKDDGKMGKYINSPQTAVYDKSRILFGLDKAKQHIKNEDVAILVEGQMDVITAHQNGFKNVIAASGTALTEAQINLLKRYTTNIALAFDMDKAGEMAAERGMKTAMQMEMNIKIIEVPNGKDPDECIRKNKTEFAEAVKNARPMMEYFFKKSIRDLDLKTIEGKRMAAKRILPMIAGLGSKIEEDYWLQKLSDKIDIKEYVLRETLAKAASKKDERKYGEEPKPVEKKKAIVSREERMSEILLALAIKFPELLSLIGSRVETSYLQNMENQALYRNFIFYYNNINRMENPEFDSSQKNSYNYEDLRKWILEKSGDELGRKLDKLSMLGDKDFSEATIEEARRELLVIIIYLKKNYLSGRMREIEKMISDAENENDQALARELTKEFKYLADELGEIRLI